MCNATTTGNVKPNNIHSKLLIFNLANNTKTLEHTV